MLYNISHNVVFKFIQGKRGDYVRPWQNPVDPLTESSNIVVPYPSDEEINGMINIGFRGPNSFNM